MIKFRQDFPVEGLSSFEIRLQRGNLTIRSAGTAQNGYVESTGELDITTRENTVIVHQPVFEHGDVEVALPPSIQDLRCSSGRGKIRLENIETDLDAHTGKGNVILLGGKGRARLATGKGDMRVTGWQGSLELSTGKGNIETQNIKGDVKVATVHGDVKIDDLQGNLNARTGKGNFYIYRNAGDIDINTGHGDVFAVDMSGGKIEANTGRGGIEVGGRLDGAKAVTGHGDIAFRGKPEAGTYQFQTGHGDILLDFAEDAEVRLDVSTRHGSVKTDLPLVKVGTSGPEGNFSHRFVGSFGNSDLKATMVVRTNRGNIIVSRTLASHNMKSEQVQPHISNTSEDTHDSDLDTNINQHQSTEIAILESLSRGEISVDEAAILLSTTIEHK